MALLPVSTKCPCGHEMKTAIRKPKFSEPAVKKFNCKECGSIYLLTCERTKDQGGARIFQSKFEIIDLSDAAKRALDSKASFKAKKVISKFVRLQEKGGIILTDMDECETG